MKTTITGIRRWFEAGRGDANLKHVCFPLRGRIKGETGERNHLLVSVYETASGIKVGVWMDRLLACCREMGRSETGYLFSDSKKRVRQISDYNPQFIERLEEIHGQRPDLFAPGTNVGEEYSLVRSLRRGSTTLAQVRGVRAMVIDLNNRWRKIERARGRAPNLSMRELYSEIMLMLSMKLEYSRNF